MPYAFCLLPTGREEAAFFAAAILTIHSSLAAVGMMAAVSRVLAEAGISTNPVAAFHHDHLFVQWAARHHAIDLIRQLASSTIT